MGFEKYINIIACYLVIQFHFTNAMKLDITPTIAVLGGTGKTGSECVYQALKSGMRVVILARDPSKLVIPEGSGGNDAGKELKDPNLIVVSGSVTKQEDVDKVFEGQNISGVVIALGGRTSSVGTTMLTCGTTCVVNAMKRNNVKRVAVVTSLGTGDSKSYAPWKFKILMLTVMKKIFIDKNNQEKIFLDNNGIGNDLE
jgi:putative NADH-flavin reductase